EHDQRQTRAGHPHGLVQTVDRVWRERFQLRVAGLARGVRGVEQLLRTGELRDHAVGPGHDPADAAAHAAHGSCPSGCGSAPGSIVRISKIEIIGRKRMKSASRKRKSPIEPRYIAQSQIVPWYIPHDDGRKSRLRLVGMITK